MKKAQKWAKKGQNWAKINFLNGNSRNNLNYIYIPNFRVLGWLKRDLLPFWTSFWPILTPPRDHFFATFRALFRKVLGIFAFREKFWKRWKKFFKMNSCCFFDPGPPPYRLKLWKSSILLTLPSIKLSNVVNILFEGCSPIFRALYDTVRVKIPPFWDIFRF